MLRGTSSRAVHFEPVKANEPVLKVRLYEALEPGSTTYTLSDIELLVPARHMRVGNVEMIGVRNMREAPTIVLVDYPSTPPGVPPGGVYVEAELFGPQSACCCCLWLLLFWPVAIFIPFFPCDRTVLYQAPDGSYWHPDGRFAGY